MATDTTGDDGLYMFPSVPWAATYWVKFNGPNEEYVSWRAESLTVDEQDVDREIYYLPKVITLSPPGYSSPADGETVSMLPVSLDWEAHPDAVNYEIEVRITDGRNWFQIEHVWTNDTDPMYTIVAPLDSGARYSWSVRAVDSEGHDVGNSEAPFTFRVDTP